MVTILGGHDLAGEPEKPKRGRGRCNVQGCGAVGPEEEQDKAQARMVWHVYKAHNEVWRMLHAGNNPAPTEPRPES